MNSDYSYIRSGYTALLQSFMKSNSTQEASDVVQYGNPLNGLFQIDILHSSSKYMIDVVKSKRSDMVACCNFQIAIQNKNMLCTNDMVYIVRNMVYGKHLTFTLAHSL